MLLRHSFQLEAEAASVEMAVREVLADGHRTRDLAAKTDRPITTSEMGQIVAGRVRERVQAPAN
jgi:3-isopropylmalate dehydrogenase